MAKQLTLYLIDDRKKRKEKENSIDFNEEIAPENTEIVIRLEIMSSYNSHFKKKSRTSSSC